MIDERYTAPLSRYSKTNSGMSVDAVEAWLDQFPQKRAENKPNGGIIRSIADTRELYLREMSPRERKVARAKAQREHREALKSLAKQNEKDKKNIAKQLSKWRAEEKINAKTTTNAMTAAGQEVLDVMKEKGFYEIADFKMSYKYFQQILAKIKELGHSIKAEREGRTIVRYVLIK